MSKRKPEGETDASELLTAKPLVCGACHLPKTRQVGTVDGRQVVLFHKQVCKGVCTKAVCDHRSHPKRAKKSKQATCTSLTPAHRQAIIAGFRPANNIDFKQEWEKHLQEEGIDSSSAPNPSQLDAVIKAARDYAHTTAHKHVTTPEAMTASSANAVINIFESHKHSKTSTSTLTSPPPSPFRSQSMAAATSVSPSSPGVPVIPHKYQCTNCNYISDMSCKDVVCSMCRKGTMLTARADARFSPDVFNMAMAIIASEQATATTTTTTTHNTSTSTSTHTPQPSISTCAPSSSSSSSCSTPMKKKGTDWLHIDVDGLVDDIGSLSDDDGVLPVQNSKLVTMGTQTEPPQTRTVGTQTQHNMIFKPLTNTMNSMSDSLEGLKISSVFPVKKPVPVPSNKENIPVLN